MEGSGSSHNNVNVQYRSDDILKVALYGSQLFGLLWRITGKVHVVFDCQQKMTKLSDGGARKGLRVSITIIKTNRRKAKDNSQSLQTSLSANDG